MLQQLLELASDHSADSRRQLLFAVTDLFLANVTESPEAGAHFSEIVAASVGSIAADARVAYAARVAPEDKLPRDVARRLARDPDVAVATIILRLSPVLSDADLVAIASTHSPDHVLAIAERAILSPLVTDAVIGSGHDAAIQRVSANEGAQFSKRGMSDLMKKARDDRTILSNLSQRGRTLAPAEAKRLQAVMGEFHSAHHAAAGPMPSRRAAQGRRPEVSQLLAELKSGDTALDDVAVLLAADDRAFDLARVIATVSGVPDAQILKALLEPDAAGIAVACRSVGLSTEGFKAILRLRATRLNQSARQTEQELKAFEDLPREISDHAIRFLKARVRMG